MENISNNQRKKTNKAIVEIQQNKQILITLISNLYVYILTENQMNMEDILSLVCLSWYENNNFLL